MLLNLAANIYTYNMKDIFAYTCNLTEYLASKGMLKPIPHRVLLCNLDGPWKFLD